MAELTDWAETEIVDHFFRNTAIVTPPANIAVDLYTVAPTDAGGGTKVTGGSYLAQNVNTSTGWSGSGGSTDNVALITFPTATANLGTIVAVGLFHGANLYGYSSLTASRTVNNGDDYRFAVGALDHDIA